MSGLCAQKLFCCMRILPSSSGIMLHRLHITLFLRLSRCTDAATLAALLYSAFLLVTAGDRAPSASRTCTMLYLASFTTHFGTQIWMTLISGIVLFLRLPRKVFGMVQRHLFPNYFLLNSVLGFLTLWTFVLRNPECLSQRWSLAICFLCDVAGMMYIVPDMIQTMTERAKIEEEHGVGQDVVGRFVPNDQLKACPRYVELHARFRLFHGLCALVNLLAMACNTYHLYHLAGQLIDR